MSYQHYLPSCQDLAPTCSPLSNLSPDPIHNLAYPMEASGTDLHIDDTESQPSNGLIQQLHVNVRKHREYCLELCGTSNFRGHSIKQQSPQHHFLVLSNKKQQNQCQTVLLIPKFDRGAPRGYHGQWCQKGGLTGMFSPSKSLLGCPPERPRQAVSVPKPK